MRQHSCPRWPASLRSATLAAAAVAVFLCVSSRAVEAPGPDAARGEVVRIIFQLLQPMSQAPPEGRAWWCEFRLSIDGNAGGATAAWDGAGNLAFRLEAGKYGAASAAFTRESSWLHVPKHDVLFTGSAPEPGTGSPLAACRMWPQLKTYLGGAALAACLAPLPDGFRLEKPRADQYLLQPANRSWRVDVQGKPGELPLRISSSLPVAAELQLTRWGQVDTGELTPLLQPPAQVGHRREVEGRHLRGMAATVTDMLCEKLLLRVKPGLVPSHFPELPRVSGKPVLVLRGTPEEIGRQYGEQLKVAVVDNVHRVLHGVGFITAVDSGRWLPGELALAWERQQTHIPKRYVAEIDAMAAAAGLPAQWARHTNVFPELFHCSGLAYRGTATVDGQMMHGRILDYMTEVGLQLNAVITVIVPEGRHAWVNIGYAGCLGTVSCMNQQGLVMGEMGGRGEGHLDGMPMAFMMREVAERFTTVKQALAWMRSVPRTCEYFYVLSDAADKDMAGVVSYARTLAAEKGVEDLQIVAPGAGHPLLPRPLRDTVMMSAGARYERLADRTARGHGKLTPEIVWEIMGEGVAMDSALHMVLFMPETLDFWVADAGLNAEPAYTQPRARLNLRSLLQGHAGTRAAIQTD